VTEVFSFTPEEMELIRSEAKKKLFNRRNSWMTNISEEKMLRQQLCGQLGNAGLSKLLCGTLEMYIEDRRRANMDKYQGDHGMDVPDMPIDIKTSWASCGWDYDYQLWVPGWDYKPRINYVLGLVPRDNFTSVHIIGWKRGTNLRPDPCQGNEGRMGISWKNLNPLETLTQKYGRNK